MAWKVLTGKKVAIDFQAAEYLVVLISVMPWGNQKRRAEASANLSQAMGTKKMNSSLNCWALPTVSCPHTETKNCPKPKPIKETK